MTRDPVRGSFSHSTDVKQLEEEKQTLESQLEEISAQLEADGYTSVAQMRSVLFFKLLSSFKVLQPESCATFYLGQSLLWPARCVLQRLQQENQALKESRGRAGAVRLGGNKQPSLRSQTWEEEEEEEGDEEEDVEKEEGTSPQNAPAGKRGPPSVNLSKERGKRQCTRPLTARHSQPVTCHTE